DERVVHDGLDLLVAVAKRRLDAADAPRGRDRAAHLLGQVLEDAIGAHLLVVREEAREQFLRSAHPAFGGAAMLLKRETELGDGCTQIVACLVHAKPPYSRRAGGRTRPGPSILQECASARTLRKHSAMSRFRSTYSWLHADERLIRATIR